MKANPPLRFTASLSLAVFFLSSSLHAQTQWIGGSGNWKDAANWTNGVPTSAVDASFPGDSSGTVLFDQNQTYRNLVFSEADADYIFKSNNVTAPRLDNTAGNFHLGQDSSGSSLTLEGIHLRARGFSSVGRQATAGSAFVASNNTLTIRDSGTIFEVISTAQLAIGRSVAGGVSADNNAIYVENGGSLKAGSIALGTDGKGNAVIVKGTGTTMEITGATGFNFDIGSGTNADSTNLLSLSDGATGSITQQLRIYRGEAHVGAGSTLAVTNGISIGLGGKLSGSGIITGNVQSFLQGSGSGAAAEIGDEGSDFGILSINGNWNNSGITLKIDLGDLTDAPEAGVGFDLLSVDGTFTFGGTVEIDLAQIQFGDLSIPIQIIEWDSFAGQETDLTLSFVNGAALSYSFTDNGLFLHSIPEPSSVLLVLGAGIGLLAVRSWKRA